MFFALYILFLLVYWLLVLTGVFVYFMCIGLVYLLKWILVIGCVTSLAIFAGLRGLLRKWRSRNSKSVPIKAAPGPRDWTPSR